MEEVVGSLMSRNYSINDDLEEFDETKAPLLPKSRATPSSSASTFVSSISSTFTKHANSFMDEGDEDEDEEDDTERFVQNIRNKRSDTTVRLPQSKKIDFQFYKKSRKMLRSIRHPNSVKRSWWYLLITIIAFYNVIAIPLRLAFRRLWNEREALEVMYFFDYLCDVICIVDVVLNFFSSYMEQGECQWNAKKTAMRYLRTIFVFDFVSTIPIDVVVWSSVWKHMLFRIPRMLRLLKVPGYFSYVERQSARPYLFTLFKVVAGALAINHIFACGYYGVAYYEGFGKTKFVPGEEMERAGLDEQYLNAFWWAANVMTRVGGSPIPPVTSFEKGIMLPVAFFTLFFVAFVIGGVSEALNRVGANMSRFRRKVDAINAYMSAKNIPPKLKRRVREYFDQLWARGGGQDDSSILREFPEHLRTQLSVHINGEIVPKVPFFANCSGGFIKAIVAHLKPHIFAPGDWIVREGDAGSDMFFISRGNVSISSASGEALSILGEGDYFGEICLMIDTPRTASVRSLNYCDLFSLDKRDLSTVLQLFPNERPLLQSLAEKRIGHDFLRNILCRDPFLLHCIPSFISSLSDTFSFQRFFQLQFIFKYGNTLHSDSAFFIASGSLEILNPQGLPLCSLSEGEFFGLHSLLQSIVAPDPTPFNPTNHGQTDNSVYSSLETSSFTPASSSAVPMTPLSSLHQQTTQTNASGRNVSIRAQSPVCVIFTLEKVALEHLLSDPEFSGQKASIKKAWKENSARSNFSASTDKDVIFRQQNSIRVPIGSSSLGKGGLNTENANGSVESGKQTNVDFPDSIGAPSDPSGDEYLSKRRPLRKQMSAFLKTPLEAAREIMRAKQRSATLARNPAQSLQGSPSQQTYGGFHPPSAPSSVAPLVPNPVSPISSSSSRDHPSLMETEVEMSLISTLFGTPNRSVSMLSPPEALHLLQLLSTIQASAIQRAASGHD